MGHQGLPKDQSVREPVSGGGREICSGLSTVLHIALHDYDGYADSCADRTLCAKTHNGLSVLRRIRDTTFSFKTLSE